MKCRRFFSPEKGFISPSKEDYFLKYILEELLPAFSCAGRRVLFLKKYDKTFAGVFLRREKLFFCTKKLETFCRRFFAPFSIQSVLQFRPSEH